MLTDARSLVRGQQKDSPIQGKQKNCNTWGEYEPAGTSPTAKLCNGGSFEGEFFEPCPAREECRSRTRQRAASQDRVEVRTSQERPFGSSLLYPGDQPLTRREEPYRWSPDRVPTSAPTRPIPAVQPISLQPTAVIPPDTNPVAMQTPYASPMAANPAGNVSPTFLPVADENVWSRLGRNITQGWLNSTGWHAFDFTRNVDLFRRR